MGDEEHHLAGALPDVEDELLHRFAGERIERPQRLVHEHQFGIGGQRAGDADALLHAAGQLVDCAPGEVLQPDQPELFHRHLAPPGGRDATHAQAELDVVYHVEPGHQGVLLEHDAAIGARTVDRVAVELDRAFGGRQEAGDAVEQRRLATPRGADGDQEGAVAQRQIDVSQGIDDARLGRVTDAEMADVELGQPGSLRRLGGGARPF